MKRERYDVGKEESAIIFGNALSVAMTDNGLEPKDFEEFDICSTEAINSYLRFERMPNMRTALKIADFLHVSLDWLCGRDSGAGLYGNTLPINERKKDNERNDISSTAPWLL